MDTVKEKEQAGKTDMQEMMRVYKELGTPGASHKLLSRMAGKWKTRTKSWTEPNKLPEESTGTSEQEMIFDGRYLQQKDTGQMMGTPFTGLGFTGYDNNTRKYFTAWMDSMSTGIYFFEGTASADGRTITMENRYNDPVRGPMTYRSVFRMIDDNTCMFEMYGTVKGGKEEKMMESTYTREK